MATNKKKTSEETGALTVANVQPGGPLALAKVNDLNLSEMSSDIGAGFEHVRADDLAIPFVTILQGLSPQVAQGVEGARPGRFYNTVTGEIFDYVDLIPCGFTKMWVEWRSRDIGGGFVRQHPTDELMATATRDEKNYDILPNGNHLIPTAYHYCLLVDAAGVPHRVVLGLTRVQLKKSRKWMSRQQDQRLPIGPNGAVAPAPTFGFLYRCTTEMEHMRQNANQTYYTWVFGEAQRLTFRDLYLAGRAFHQEVEAGKVTVTPPDPETTEPTSNSFAADEEVPF
jgi:hypothetical protein